jgi:hypothetical protein
MTLKGDSWDPNEFRIVAIAKRDDQMRISRRVHKRFGEGCTAGVSPASARGSHVNAHCLALSRLSNDELPSLPKT